MVVAVAVLVVVAVVVVVAGLSGIGNTDKRTHNLLNSNNFTPAHSHPDLGSLMIPKPCIVS